MAKIRTEEAFQKLSPEIQLKTAKLPANKELLKGIAAQCLPHSCFSNLKDTQLVQLVESAFIFDCAVTVAT